MTTHADKTMTNQEYQERFLLAAERIRQIPEEARELTFASDYFHQTASYVSMILDTYDAVNQGKLYTMSLEELQQHNHDLYADILPENYSHSYANPDYALCTLCRDAWNHRLCL